MTDPFVSVYYIVATGGSGFTRMRLSEVPDWLASRTGVLIHQIKEI